MKKSGSLGILALLFALPAAARVIDAESVSVTGSRLLRSLDEVSAQTYVITREDIEGSAASTVLDLLNRVPGLTGVTGSAAMTLNQAVTVRGLFTEVLLLVDGVPCNLPSHGTGTGSSGYAYDLRSLPLDSVERIEVVKGASSAIYGSHAAAGVISVTTRKSALENELVLKGEGGSGGWLKGSVQATAAGGKGLRASVSYVHTEEGERKIKQLTRSAALLAGHAYDLSRQYRGDDYGLSLDWKNWRLSAAFGESLSRWDNTVYAVTSEAGQKNKYGRISLAFDNGVKSIRLYYIGNTKDYWQQYNFTTYDDQIWGASWSRRSPILGLPGVWGMEARKERSEGAGELRYKRDRLELAPFAEVSIAAGEVVVDLGLRGEYWDMDGSAADVRELLPRLSASWQSPSGALWYASAGRFFATPSLYEISAGTGPLNPDLKPERGWSYDLGVKNGGAKNPWSLGLFMLDMEDKVKYVVDPASGAGVFLNVNRYRAWGAEAQVKIPLGKNWSWTQGLSYVKGEEKTEGGAWSRTGMPCWDLSGRLGYASGRWNAEAELHYYADHAALPIYDGEESFFLMNLALSWKGDESRFRLAVGNLFNKEIVINYSGFITPERRWVLSWEQKF